MHRSLNLALNVVETIMHWIHGGRSSPEHTPLPRVEDDSDCARDDALAEERLAAAADHVVYPSCH